MIITISKVFTYMFVSMHACNICMYEKKNINAQNL